MKSRKMSKALTRSHCKVKINQTQCPVLLRMFFKSEILSDAPNHYCLYYHISLKIPHTSTQTSSTLYILKHHIKVKRAYANKNS